MKNAVTFLRLLVVVTMTSSSDDVGDACATPTDAAAAAVAACPTDDRAARDSFARRKLIVYWTTYYSHRDFEFGFGEQPFIAAGCRVSACFASSDKSLVSSADAVLFHMRNVGASTRYPDRRPAHQRYVFFLMEHPHHQWNDLSQFGSFFNWTMTYRRDSDIPLLYGRVVARTAAMPPPPAPPSAALIAARKPIAWFVSNCRSHSGREEYVARLQQHIVVDVYGECGPLRCPAHTTPDHRMDPHCYQMLERQYNFYISFENNFCTDYVTEKMFNILKLNVVPIVFGGTRYERDAPAHSVIDISDFPSPAQLAAYVTSLLANQQRYLQYFRWKRTHTVVTKQAHNDAFCKLCEKLHDATVPNTTHVDIDTWWGKHTQCNLHVMQQLKTKGRW